MCSASSQASRRYRNLAKEEEDGCPRCQDNKAPAWRDGDPRECPLIGRKLLFRMKPLGSMHQEDGPDDDLLSGYLRQLRLDEEEEKEEEKVNVPEEQFPTWRLERPFS